MKFLRINRNENGDLTDVHYHQCAGCVPYHLTFEYQDLDGFTRIRQNESHGWDIDADVFVDILRGLCDNHGGVGGRISNHYWYASYDTVITNKHCGRYEILIDRAVV